MTHLHHHRALSALLSSGHSGPESQRNHLLGGFGRQPPPVAGEVSRQKRGEDDRSRQEARLDGKQPVTR